MNGKIGARGNLWFPRFWEEFRLVPRPLVWAIAVLFVLAQINNFLVNRWNFQHHGEIFLPAMSLTLWTLLQFLLLPGFFVAGFLLYLVMRKPLPFPCPHGATSVLPGFHFCPNRKSDLRSGEIPDGASDQAMLRN